MKFLLYGINYAPEPTGIGKYTGEMAQWLAARGHQVQVVTAPPYYPQWQVGAGHSAWRYQSTGQAAAGHTQVTRCPLWVPAKPSGLKRALHLLSFAATSLPVVLWQAWRHKPDVVWVCAPAFACTPGALLAAKAAGAKSWLHVQDYEVDVAFDTGLLKGRTLFKAVSALERWVMRRFDTVSSISQRMLDKARDKGVAPKRIKLFRNWVDVNAVVPYPGRSPYRDELGLRDDQVVAMFSGTLSAKQGLQQLPEVARQLHTLAPQVVLVIGGDGAMKQPLQDATRDLPNVRMLPLQPKERMAEWLGMADMHLLTQEPDVADLVMPSKLTAMLSSGRPVVATAHAGTELAAVVQQCGVVTVPGLPGALAEAIAQLAKNPACRQALGQAARQFAVAHLGADQVLGQFEADAGGAVSNVHAPGGLLPSNKGATAAPPR